MSIDIGQVAELVVYVTEFDSGNVNLQGPQGEPGTPGQGVAQGGAVESVLVKLSDADFHTAWTDSLKMKTVSFKGEVDNGLSGAGKIIDFSLGQKQVITLNQTTTLTFDTPPGVGNYQLRIVQDAVGGRAVSYLGLASNRWLNSVSVPELNALPNGESIISLYWDGSKFTQGLTKVGAR